MDELEDLVKDLRQSDFPKHATLIESKAGMAYLNELLRARWESEVKNHFGNRLYSRFIQTLGDRYSSLQTLEAIFDRNKPLKNINFPKLTIEVEPLTQEQGEEAIRTIPKILELLDQAVKRVYQEVQDVCRDDDEFVYRIFNRNYKEMTIDEYCHRIRQKIETKKNLEQSGSYDLMPQLEARTTNSLIELFPNLCKQYGLDYEDITSSSDEDPYLAKKIIGSSKLDEMLLDIEKKIDGKKPINKDFREYLRRSKVFEKKREINAGKRRINFESEDPDINDIDLNLIIRYGATDDDFDFDFDLVKTEDIISELLKRSLKVKETYVSKVEDIVEKFSKCAKGLDQIVSGSPVLNPNIDEVNICQNDAEFPNIKYSSETIQVINAILPQVKAYLDGIPDISDLALPKRIRKQTEVTYEMREMPKNPIDITFGNESGWCIFFSNSLDKMHNGVYIPAYFSTYSVKLFEIVKKRNQREDRMGLVIAFDTYIKDGDKISDHKILAANSLELSRRGIVGGKKTIKEIVDYAESWLVEYAKQGKYSGAVMGSHNYNTSFNHSSNSGDIVKETLLLSGALSTIYGDIFDYGVDDKHRQHTREDSCYWLHKSEALENK